MPGSAPRNIFVANQSADRLYLTWLPPEQSYGIITNYTIRINFTNGTDSISYSTSTNQFISNFQPYQTITVTISANNSKGEGPSNETSFTTDESRTLERLMITTYDILKVLHSSSVQYLEFLTILIDS